MKGKKTVWRCVDCGYSETNHKQMDGVRCPKCGSPYWVGKKVK